MAIIEVKSADILDQLPEAFRITDTSGDIVFFNAAAQRLTGYRSDEVVNKNVALLIPETDRSRLDVITWFGRWADDPEQTALRYLNLEGVTRAGDKLLYRVRVSRANDAAGDTFFLVLIRDVTEEYSELKDSQHARLIADRIIAIGDDGILTLDADRNIKLFNARAERIFGYDATEVIGKPIETLLPERTRSAHPTQISSFTNSNTPTRLMGERGEVAGLHKDGHEIPLEVSITKTRIRGDLLLSAQIKDITHRKQLEKDLRASEQRYRALFEASLEAMALLSADGTVLEINDAARQLLPASETAINRSFWLLDWWPDASSVDVKTASDNLKQLVERARNGDVIRQRIALNREQASHEIDFSLNPVISDNDEISFIVAEGRVLKSL